MIGIEVLPGGGGGGGGVAAFNAPRPTIRRPVRAIVVGALLGLGLFGVLARAFVKGCPMFDPILDRDTILGF